MSVECPTFKNGNLHICIVWNTEDSSLIGPGLDRIQIPVKFISNSAASPAIDKTQPSLWSNVTIFHVLEGLEVALAAGGTTIQEVNNRIDSFWQKFWYNNMMVRNHTLSNIDADLINNYFFDLIFFNPAVYGSTALVLGEAA